MKRETNLVPITVFAMLSIGVLMVYSASAVRPGASPEFQKHMIYIALGLAVMAVASRFDYHRLRDPGVYRGIVFLSLCLLVLVLVPGIGRRVNGGMRWIRIAGFSFQPSEFAKVALILLLAVKLSAGQERITSFWRGVFPTMLIAFLFAGLIVLERDLGMPVVLIGVTLMMLLMSGARWGHVVGSVVPCVAAVAALTVISPYRVRRCLVFLNPWPYEDGDAWNLVQSLAAFARGAIWGQGPGASEQKLFYLPAADTDFIFAIWGEDTGLVGTLVMVGLFVTFLAVALRIALHAPDLFGTLLAGGIASVIALQAALNMAVTTGLVPTKGLPLPFVSYGGSSLLISLALVGVLRNIGLQSCEAVPEGKVALVR